MPDNRDNSPSKVSLDQLLQLKRSERPDASFWESFDQELHRRQLAALVNVEPWHVRAAKSLAIGLRRAAPLGALALAVAGGVLTVLRTNKASIATEPAPTVASNLGAQQIVRVAPAPVSVAADEVAAPPVAVVNPALDGPARYATEQILPSTTSTSTRRFVTVVSPNTFSHAADAAGVYAVNALKSASGQAWASASGAESF